MRRIASSYPAEQVHTDSGLVIVLIEREHDIVRSDGVGRGEEAEHRLERPGVRLQRAVLALPLLDIALHGDFLSGAVIGISCHIGFPSKMMAHRIELHHIRIFSVDDAAIVDVDWLRLLC